MSEHTTPGEIKWSEHREPPAWWHRLIPRRWRPLPPLKPHQVGVRETSITDNGDGTVNLNWEVHVRNDGGLYDDQNGINVKGQL